MKLRIRLKEPAAPQPPKRSQVSCPLCGHGTWSTHLEKHLHNPDCVFGQRRIALHRQGFEPASGYFQILKKAGVPLVKHPTDRAALGTSRDTTGKWTTTYVEQERYWAPRWALAVCQVHDKIKRATFLGAAVELDRKGIHEELRAMMAQPAEVQEAFIAEARVFFKAVLWYEEGNEEREAAPAQEA